MRVGGVIHEDAIVVEVETFLHHVLLQVLHRLAAFIWLPLAMDVELDQKQDALPSSNVVLTGVEGILTVPEHLPEPQEQLTGHRSGPLYRARYILSGHSLSISSVKFSPDGSLLASSGMSASPVASRPSCSFCLEGSRR